MLALASLSGRGMYTRCITANTISMWAWPCQGSQLADFASKTKWSWPWSLCQVENVYGLHHNRAMSVRVHGMLSTKLVGRLHTFMKEACPDLYVRQSDTYALYNSMTMSVHMLRTMNSNIVWQA